MRIIGWKVYTEDYRFREGEIEIRDGAQYLADKLFTGCDNVPSITIPAPRPVPNVMNTMLRVPRPEP